MIRRTDGYDWFLTTQADHAAFAGELAAHYGNETFDPPHPQASVLTAITLHDAGWALHDDEPGLNERGEPLHVFETPLNQLVKIWAASVDRARESADDYSALLVSLHQLSLSAMAHPSDQGDPRRNFELNKFQQKQIEQQAILRAAAGLRTDLRLNLGLARPATSNAEDELHRNFRLLTLADRLSLQMCCGKLLFGQIGDIVPRAGVDPIVLTTRFLGEAELVVDPWPFDVSRFAISVPVRRLPSAPFTEPGVYREALKSATPEAVTFTLRSMAGT